MVSNDCGVESLDSLALAVAGASDGVWDRDLVSGQMYYSRRALELLGVDPDQEGTRTFEQWESCIQVHPQDRWLRQASIDAHIAGDSRHYNGEWRVRHADGNYRWVGMRGRCVRDEYGRATRFAGLISDIEERKRHQSELGRQRTLLDELIDNAPEGIVLFDRLWRVQRVNSEFTRLFGYEEGELVGKDSMDQLVPAEQAAAIADFRARMEIGEVVNTETVNLRSDGKRVDVSILGAPIFAGRQRIGTYLIYRDISERRRADTERARLQQRLRQAEKMEALGRLAAGVAHDFNNVLGVILGYGEQLLVDAPAGSKRRLCADNVITAGMRGRDLVRQILVYSRSEPSARSPIDIVPAVHETLELVRGSIPAGICLGARLVESPLVVVCNETQLHQVVMNLCTNAIQAMSGAGQLRVGVEPIEIAVEREALHGSLPAGRYASITVSDTGTGMDSATLERIFEPFFTTKRVGLGTGLGLALVHTIVTESGGAIDVESAPGEGTQFTIYLPTSSRLP